MSRRTLYVTDLDGTLFSQQAEVSPISRRLLGTMLDDGLLFSVATARSAASATQKLAGIPFTLPIAMMNGVLLYDTRTATYARHVTVEPDTARRVISAMEDAHQTAYVFTFANNQLYANYKSLSTPFQNQFYRERKDSGLKKFVQVADFYAVAQQQDVVFFSITGAYEELLPLRDAVAATTEGLEILMYEDFHDSIWYLEMFSALAGKAPALRWLAEYCGAQETVCFGDNYNDVGMMRAATRSYAVANAVDAAKEAALAVIGPNSADAVANFIWEEFYR